MIFEELKYIYKGTSEYEKEKEFYINILNAELVWEFSRFAAKVVAFRLGKSTHLVLVADHLEPDDKILIYRTENLNKSIDSLKSKGLEFNGGTFGIPDGNCIRFRDFSGTEYGLYEQNKPDTYLRDEYIRQQSEKK